VPELAQRHPEQAEGAALFIVGHVIAEDHRELGAEDRQPDTRHEACDHGTRDELDEATQAEDPCHDLQEPGNQRGRDQAPHAVLGDDLVDEERHRRRRARDLEPATAEQRHDDPADDGRHQAHLRLDPRGIGDRQRQRQRHQRDRGPG
jgi:hypothetical protein